MPEFPYEESPADCKFVFEVNWLQTARFGLRATDGDGGENCGWIIEKSADGLGGVKGLCKLLRGWPTECDRILSDGTTRPKTNPHPAKRVNVIERSALLLWYAVTCSTC